MGQMRTESCVMTSCMLTTCSCTCWRWTIQEVNVSVSSLPVNITGISQQLYILSLAPSRSLLLNLFKGLHFTVSVEVFPPTLSPVYFSFILLQLIYLTIPYLPTCPAVITPFLASSFHSPYQSSLALLVSWTQGSEGINALPEVHNMNLSQPIND